METSPDAAELRDDTYYDDHPHDDAVEDHELGGSQLHDDDAGYDYLDDEPGTVVEHISQYRWQRLAVLGGLGSWAILALLTLAVVGRIGNPVDATFYEMSPGFDSWNLARVMQVGRTFGDIRLVAPVAVILYGVALWRPAWRRPGSYAFVTFVLGIGVGTALKYLLAQPGPPEFGVQADFGTAFPSGHAMVATIFYGVLAGFAATFVSARRLPALAAWWEIAALGVGTCQVLLRTHWLSDVVAAWLYGFGWVCLAAAVIGWLEKRRSRRIMTSAG